MFTMVKIVVSAVVIGIVTLIAGRDPKLGGWIAALPLTTVLAVIWLTVDGQSGVELGRFVDGVLWGLIPTTAMLLAVAYCLKRGLPAIPALGLGMIAWIAISLAAQRLGLIRW
ncbi:MAG: DUF3147 family protein [Chloroflexota bacterium]|nr:DUF3147 family protein [Chloroflexota bacterium]